MAVVLLIIAAVVLAVLLFTGMILCICDEDGDELEIARINRERRRAEAQIHRLTISAIQQMADAAQQAQNRREPS
ncbi:MAG: hypothetical protein QM673_07045 [Gordonia sp. (in: high G+C Gram-positive bacteria)]